jgi:hypothetical protein
MGKNAKEIVSQILKGTCLRMLAIVCLWLLVTGNNQSAYQTHHVLI